MVSHNSLPRHRVIHTDGRIGGYAGIKNSQKKIKLLKHEGIRIERGVRIDNS